MLSSRAEECHLLVRVLEFKLFWVSGCGYTDITFVQDFLNEVATEACGAAGDKEDSRHDDWYRIEVNVDMI